MDKNARLKRQRAEARRAAAQSRPSSGQADKDSE
jgi:hypothetical protein